MKYTQAVKPQPVINVSASDGERSIWTWEYDPKSSSNEALRVTNVFCAVKRQNYSLAKVLNAIEWGRLSLYLNKKELALPIEEKFFMKGDFLHSGHIHGGSGLWQLPANTDSSFLMVFGYQIDNAGGLSPVPNSEWWQDNLMAPIQSFKTKSTDKTHSFQVRPRRVVVCMSLVCCKERSDWDPLEALDVARIYPHVMVMANFDLNAGKNDWIESRIRILRPKEANHDSAHHSGHGATMGGLIEPFLFTDTNDVAQRNAPWAIPNFPYWDNLFDYYNLNPKPREKYVVVDPDLGARDIKNAVTYANEDRDSTVKKLARQGAYDNIHLAPYMNAPPGWSKISQENRKRWNLDKIIMSPICVHDCLHTHWRWNDDYGNKQNRGWDENGPYAKAGAPLVPVNHKVTLELLSQGGSVGFEIHTKIYSTKHPIIPAGKWQVINHNGSGYAVGSGFKVGMGAFGINIVTFDNLPDGTDLPAFDEWWAFYWLLRYSTKSGGSIRERVSVVSVADLKRLENG